MNIRPPTFTQSPANPMSSLLSAKVRVARALTHPWVGRALDLAFRHRIPSRGLRVQVDGPGVGPETTASLFWGFYESAEIRFVQRWLRRDLDVVELGASIGVVSSHIARRIAPDRRLVSVEANPSLIPLIERNVLLNSGRKAEVRHCAVAYGAGPTVTFSVSEQNVASGIGRAGRPVEVPATTLSALLKREGYGEYALICDIEGAEAGIVLEDMDALARCRLAIFELHEGEFGGRHVDVPELERRLLDVHGFRLVARHGPVVVLTR